jgi:hypothetical protein
MVTLSRPLSSPVNQSLSHQALRVVTKDIAKITRNPPEDVRLRVNEDNIGGAGGIIGIVRGPGELLLDTEIFIA